MADDRHRSIEIGHPNKKNRSPSLAILDRPLRRSFGSQRDDRSICESVTIRVSRLRRL
ncbi:hypothetical protein CKA32_002141 [Geitlerinema sp. FC II]|nr:hypothetical protein CKA32_002141 [Geitlerinema sp. FC II]